MGVPAGVVVRLLIASVLAAAVIAALVKSRALAGVDAGEPALERTPAAGWLCGAVGLWLGVYTAGPLLALMIWTKPADGSLPPAWMVTACLYGVGIAASVMTLWLVSGLVPGRRFRAAWGDLGLGLAVFVGAAPVLVAAADVGIVAATLVEGRPPDLIAHQTLEAILSSPGDWRSWVLIAGAVVGAPVLEETIYRGLLQTGVRRALGSGAGRRWGAVVMTSFVFAGSHLVGAAVPWHALPTLLVVGLACGYAAESRGVVAAMVTHAAFNGSQVVLALVLAG